MRIKHDPEANAVYIYLADKPYAYGKSLDDERRVDYSADDTPIGIELLCISRGVNPDDLPEQDAVIRLLEKEHFRIFA